MVAEFVKNGRLHMVKDAPVIKRSVYALYSHNSEKKELIAHANGYFAS
jgi:hypothetical protein